MKNYFHSAMLILMLHYNSIGQNNISYIINTALQRDTISDYIYGTNYSIYADSPFRRWGGNRLSAYNWENNFSNAGVDYYNQNDNYLPWSMGVPSANYTTPGECLKAFHDTSLAYNAISGITLPMVGYVANDGNGQVLAGELAPSARWALVINKKGAAFTLNPNTIDGHVYVDEELNFLIQTFGNSQSAGGVKAYILDNEPGLWNGQFPRMRNYTITYNELFSKTFALASTIKQIDSHALVFGSEGYGFNEYWNLQNASDAGNYSGDHWFIDTYLKKLKHAEDTGGIRLLDVFTIHWYPEVNNVISDDTTATVRNDRMQCVRTLWDSTYTENSWITQSGFGGEFPLIPNIMHSINSYYRGTEFGITEYDYGAHGDISGGIAQADVLGTLGKYKVRYASIFADINGYVKTAFDLYRNYDGFHSPYGRINVKSSSSNSTQSTIYAAAEENTNNILHSIITNKNASIAINATITIQSNIIYDHVDAYFFNKYSQSIHHTIVPASSINNNVFTYSIPPYTVYHFVFTSSTTSIIENHINEKMFIHLYPNPANSLLTIETPTSVEGSLITLNTINGQEVIHQQIDGNITRVDVSSLAKGIYFLKLFTENEVMIKKFIKE